MKILGFHDSEFVSLVEAVVGETVSTEAGREVFARACWTGIAEPGDRVAGALVRALGAARALAWLEGDGDGPSGVDTGLPRDELAKARDRWLPRVNPTGAVLALRQAGRFRARLLVPGDTVWPAHLDDLGDHGPLALWVRGSVEAVESLSRSMALVGARAATGYGEHVTMEAAAGLADRGYTIVSGAAYGIDGMAHRAALASGGLTVAFLAGGVDRFYPSGHDALLTRIVEAGAVISELPCGSAPTRWRFLQRNRLIAAAGLATVVLEAGWRSGSLNTAGHAAQLGRPLGAVPGPVTSAASAGCHRLIRDYDAVCVTTADEMAELAPLGTTAAPDPTANRVLDALSERTPRAVGEVAVRTGLSEDEVRAALGTLGIEGMVGEREQGWLRRR